MIDKTLAHYRIIDKLGEGGMGQVFVAEDSRLGRRVALKVLSDEMARDPERLQRFEREARAVAALNHPNIVTIYSVEEADGHHFLTMELVEGKTLSEELLKGPLRLEQFFDMAHSLTDALNAAHRQGITHRDLKPANVMVGPEGRVKILDFGLAKLRGTDADGISPDIATATLTQEGLILGTVPYMSPEQLQGKPADHRSDIFSLGIMLYEMATGRRPFQGETSVDLISAILRDTPQPVTEVKVDLPHDLGRILRRCLEKDPRRRYQSVLDIHTEFDDLASDKEAAASSGPPSIAVLPFADMSPDRDQEYFCDGIAEELINALIRSGGLRVASRTAAFALKGKNLGIREMGDELNVAHLLEGSVRKAGNRLRINAQLVNVQDGYQPWAETFDREMEDVFAIQDEIARSISKALKGVLTESDDERVSRAPTENVKAYEFYLRGRQLFHRHSRSGLEGARRLFKRACQLDPEYANAWAGIADCSSFMYMYWDSSETELREAEEASRKALELDPNAAESHVARGLAVSLSRRWDEAVQEFEKAIELNPESFEAYYFFARACLGQGKYEQSADLFEQACRMRPEDYVAPALLGQVYISLDRKNESEAAYRRSLEAAESHLELYPNEPRPLYIGAVALTAVGEIERGKEWAGRALEAEPEEPMVLYNVACAYSRLGEIEKAIDCLDESITFGIGQKEWFEHDSDLDPLRDHPRFQELLARL